MALPSTKGHAMSKTETDNEWEGIEDATDATGDVKTRNRRSNYSIDFDHPVDDDEVFTDGGRTSPWAMKLATVIEAVEDGRAKIGKWYKIGEFSTSAGARSVVRGFEKNPERVPGKIEVQPRIVVKGGERCSELFARVPDDD